MKFGHKRSAVFCVLTCKDKILLLERAQPPHQGKLVPVGGKIDPFESPSDAILREVMEETGLNIHAPIFCGILVETSPIEYNWISFIYTHEIEPIDPPYCDEGTLLWVNKDEVNSLCIPEIDIHIYKYIFQHKYFVIEAKYDAQLKLIENVPLF